MTAARYPADSHEGRILLALRAGTLETTAFYERFASPQYVHTLVKKGLVARTGDGDYRLTPAGRAACPYRNPLAAPAEERPPATKSTPGKETDMKLTREAVFVAITEAGPAGIARPELCRRFDCAENAVDFHVGTLYKRGAIVKPKRGLLVAANYTAPAGIQDAAADELLAFDLEAAQSLDVTAAPRYAVAFPSDFFDTVEGAIARAVKDFEFASLKDAVVVSCTPLGGIAAGFAPFTTSQP